MAATARPSRSSSSWRRCRVRRVRSASVADAVLALPARARARAGRGRRGPAHRLDDGERLRAARADGARDAALLLRAPRHRAAGRRRCEPVVEDGFVRNAGGTILGADNKAAVVAMLEAVRRVLAENRPHAGIELLFTPMEEVGLDRRRRVRPRRGCTRSSATSTTRPRRSARSSSARRRRRRCEVRFHGRAAHSRDVPGGGPLGDPGGGEGDRRPAARAHRRGDDRERRA